MKLSFSFHIQQHKWSTAVCNFPSCQRFCFLLSCVQQESFTLDIANDLP